MTTAALRLPGIYFLPASRATVGALPPLDVCGFVGFATRGPLDTPVPVEDLTSFDMTFGGPLTLARDGEGRPLYACLRDAVAAFFTAGGRRCYCVRVAGHGPASAQSNTSSNVRTTAQFILGGMLAIGEDGEPGAALVDASSPGAWGDSLRLATRLSTTLLPPTAFSIVRNAADKTQVLTFDGALQPVQAGDVLRLAFAGDTLRTWLFPVDAVIPSPSSEHAPLGPARLTAQRVWMSSKALAASLPPTIWAVSRLGLSGFAPLQAAATFLQAESAIRLSLNGESAYFIGQGDILRLDLTDGSRHVICVSDVQSRASSGSLPIASVEITATEMLRLVSGTGDHRGLPDGLDIIRAELLRFDLRIKYAGQTAHELDSLGFNGAHARFWGDVVVAESSGLVGGSVTSSGTAQQQRSQILAPGDATGFYRQLSGDARVDIDWTDPRWRIVTTSLLAPGPSEQLTYLPVGMLGITVDDALEGPASPPALDGLQSFDIAPFVDPNLSGQSSPVDLLAAATDYFYLRNMKLKGIHSLMFVEEVALIAVPDAIQRGWETASSPVYAPAGPIAVAPLPSPAFVDCRAAKRPFLRSVAPPSGPMGGGATVTISGEGFGLATTVSFGERGAASIAILNEGVLTCKTPVAAGAGPVVVSVTNDRGTARLDGGYVYRPEATAPPLPVTIDAADYDARTRPTLLQIQAALTRLCIARADAVAILSLPLHYQKDDCGSWLRDLRQILGLPVRDSLTDDVREIADLSYAAIYHPWLLSLGSAGQGGILRAAPPDGAACGAIAARELARQVWTAPANVPLTGVLDLQPPLSDDDWADLFALGFNIVRSEAKDFRLMSAHTLSGGQSLMQLSIRRLLIQLRKAVLLIGQDYVFAKNSAMLRQQLRHTLETFLRRMFDGGAFAGATHQTSFRVTVDESLNPQESVDQGALIARIDIAPSQPTEFITVLLTRGGEGQLRAVEG